MENIRLLLLENLAADAAFLSKTLEGKGFEVITTIVRDETDLTAAINNQKVDAILTGSRIPSFDPGDAIRFIRSQNTRIPVIILTGSNQEYGIGMLMKDGADDCVMLNDLKNLAGALRESINKYYTAIEANRTSNALVGNASLFINATELANLGCWESNIVDHSERWSDEQYRILGYTPGEIEPSLGNLLRRVHPEDVMQVTQIISDAIETLDRQKFECRVITGDNVIKYIICEMAIERDAQSKPLRIYGYIKDVTEVRVAELNEKKVIADLIQRNKDLEQFAYIISHNLRGPVANIVGVSSTLLDDNLEAEESREFMGALSTSARKLDNIITDLNHILQVKKHVNENMEMVCFQQLVDEIKSSIGVFLQEQCIMIMTDFSEVEGMLALKSYMRSIFYNLISNSIKYRKPDMAPVIEIQSRVVGGKLQLTFKDNSIGIDLQKKKDQVFGLYKRFHPERAEGKGMGLYMVKTQVETLGGRISLQSKVNEGTEFKIEFEMQTHNN